MVNVNEPSRTRQVMFPFFTSKCRRGWDGVVGDGITVVSDPELVNVIGDAVAVVIGGAADVMLDTGSSVDTVFTEVIGGADDVMSDTGCSVDTVS